jgi:hypothetical protein
MARQFDLGEYHPKQLSLCEFEADYNRNMHVNDITLVTLDPTDDWIIRYHSLTNLSPEEADHLKGLSEGFSPWDGFVPDLLLIWNRITGYLIDVGWYPRSDPAGEYVLLLLPPSSEKLGESDWTRPELEYSTRDLQAITQRIQKFINNG